MISANIKTTALLIHQNTDTHSIDVTSHQVMKTTRGYTLGAGGAFDSSENNMLVQILSGNKESQPEFFPEGILYQGDEALVWHSKSRRCDISFRQHSEVVTLEAPIPAHIFAYIRGRFYAFAVKGNKRPSNDTELFFSPTGNVYSDGHVCTGNVSLPRRYTFDVIGELERFFYDAAATDTEGFEVIKGIEEYDDLISFWKGVESDKLKSFPVRKLVNFWKPLSSILSTISNTEFED